MREPYKITKKTIALIPRDSNYYQTRIIEFAKTKESMHNTEQILAESCLAYGSGIVGRRESAINILQTNINLPVPVGPDEGLFMFPTASLTNKHCVFLSYYQIKYCEPRDHKLYVEFHNGIGIYIDVSLHTFNVQMKKTAQVIADYHRKIVWE